MVERQKSSVAAVLEGGPAGLPAAWRSCRVGSRQEKVKIQYRNGYEHFERTDEEVDRHGEIRVVYRWTLRTWIAE